MELVSLVVGTTLGWIITHIYHVISNRQQKKDMDDLRQNNAILRQQSESNLAILDELRQNNAILRRHSEINLAVHEESGKLDARRDQNGTIIGKNARAHANIQAVSAIQATATVTPAAPTQTAGTET
jgi:hypothetical protein